MILCALAGTVRGQENKNNVSIPWKQGKSIIVTHSTIRVKKVLRHRLGVLRPGNYLDPL